MFAEADLDCVLVLNSDEYHAECVVAALDAGRPRAGREADVPEPARGGGDHRRPGPLRKAQVMVGYMRRFAPAFLEAKAQLADLGRAHLRRGCTTSSARTA